MFDTHFVHKNLHDVQLYKLPILGSCWIMKIQMTATFDEAFTEAEFNWLLEEFFHPVVSQL